MKIDFESHKLKVFILNQFLLIGLGDTATDQMDQEDPNTISVRLVCSLHSNTDEQGVTTYRLIPEPVPMDIMGNNTEKLYNWVTKISRAGTLCFTEINLVDGEDSQIVKNFLKFWGVNSDGATDADATDATDATDAETTTSEE